MEDLTNLSIRCNPVSLAPSSDAWTSGEACIPVEMLISTSGCASVSNGSDTRMILHAVHANNVFERNDMTGRVIIKMPDTDVLVLAIHYYLQMDRVKEFWIETGTVTRTTDLRRFIPVHDICHSQSPLFLKVLPAIHTLTGCDSTSGVFGIGKNSVYKTISEKGVDSFAELVFLGGDDENTSIVGARKFIASLYDPKGKEKEAHSNMNVLRAKLAVKREYVGKAATL